MFFSNIGPDFTFHWVSRPRTRHLHSSPPDNSPECCPAQKRKELRVASSGWGSSSSGWKHRKCAAASYLSVLNLLFKWWHSHSCFTVLKFPWFTQFLPLFQMMSVIVSQSKQHMTLVLHAPTLSKTLHISHLLIIRSALHTFDSFLTILTSLSSLA